MNKSLYRFCLTAAIAFFAGMIFGFLVLVPLSKLVSPGRYKEKREAITFFYKTMYALFEDTYNPGERTLSEEDLKKFEEHKPRLGGKCKLFIIDSTPGYYECFAIFPSGDIFNLAIMRRDGRWKVAGFHNLQDWDRIWKDILYSYQITRGSIQSK
jgi:hypothetical protein